MRSGDLVLTHQSWYSLQIKSPLVQHRISVVPKSTLFAVDIGGTQFETSTPVLRKKLALCRRKILSPDARF